MKMSSKSNLHFELVVHHFLAVEEDCYIFVMLDNSSYSEGASTRPRMNSPFMAVQPTHSAEFLFLTMAFLLLHSKATHEFLDSYLEALQLTRLYSYFSCSPN